MKKRLLRTMLMTSILATSFLVGCGEKDTKVESTTSIEATSEVESTTMEETTPIVEETTSEEVTNEVEEPTNPSEEFTTEAPTTEEETTTVVEETTTSKVEETTNAPEPTPEYPFITPTPTEAPTPVVDATTEKIRSLHLAYRPEESNGYIDWEASQEMGAIVLVPGERAMADYVDPDYGDGTKPNPYTMYEWTTRKYYAEVDEETLGYYLYKEDYEDRGNLNGIYQTKAGEVINAYMKGPNGFGLDGIVIYIGTYEGRDVYFDYNFR